MSFDTTAAFYIFAFLCAAFVVTTAVIAIAIIREWESVDELEYRTADADAIRRQTARIINNAGEKK
jgi:hypothetical protein